MSRRTADYGIWTQSMREHCPHCGAVTPHSILRYGKVSGQGQVLVARKCYTCGKERCTLEEAQGRVPQ